MSTYKELLQEHAFLTRKIDEVKAKEFAAVVDEIKQVMRDYGIGASDLCVEKNEKTKKRSAYTVSPKYRDAETGATWSGRGKSPKWIEGKDRDAFLIRT